MPIDTLCVDNFFIFSISLGIDVHSIIPFLLMIPEFAVAVCSDLPGFFELEEQPEVMCRYQNNLPKSACRLSDRRFTAG